MRRLARAAAHRIAPIARRHLGVDVLDGRLESLEQRVEMLEGHSRLQQNLLGLEYQRLVREGTSLPSLADVEFRVRSENGEDGILHFLFAIVGATDRRCVEMCAGDGTTCNTANLILNHGWQGLLFDGNAELVQRGRDFYASHPGTRIWPPRLQHAWITVENVNELLATNDVSGEIDLLSLDLDGVDWWIWEAIDVVRPRVVVLEYQDCWEADVAVTVPYAPDFVAEFGENWDPLYAGASLAAFVALGKHKGYRYVGSQYLGYNAFFLREDVGAGLVPEAPVEAGLQHPKHRWAVANRQPKVRDRPWVDVRDVL